MKFHVSRHSRVPRDTGKPRRHEPLPYYDLADYEIISDPGDTILQLSPVGSEADSIMSNAPTSLRLSTAPKRKTILTFPVKPEHYSTSSYRLDFISFLSSDTPSVSADGNKTTYTDVKVQQLIRRSELIEDDDTSSSRSFESEIPEPCWTDP